MTGMHTYVRVQHMVTAIGFWGLSILGANAQEARAPKGPIEITVPSSAGGTPDVVMRRVAQILNQEKIIEQPVVVVNRVGGAWAVGMNYVVNRPRDENTLIVLGEAIVSLPIAQGLPVVYNRYTSLAILLQAQLIVVTQPKHEANNLAELVAIARKNPRAVRLAGSNAYSPDAMVSGLIEKAAGVDLTYIPHDGGGAAQATFLGGNTDIITLNVDEALPLIKAGKAKALAILNAERRPEPELKDIPTAKEQGVDVVWNQIFGLAAPPELDPAAVKWWDEKIAQLAKTEAWQNFLKQNYLVSTYKSSSEAKLFMENMHQSRLDVLRGIGVAKL
jgi:putative tricarboxylic transport membrane protein